MAQKGTDKLTTRQVKAIEALLIQPGVRAAARAAGIGHVTLYRWLEIPEFREALREARRRSLERVLNSLQGASELALEVLHELLGDDAASIRIRAVRTALDGTLRAHALIETEERLRRIEEQLESILNQRGK